MATFVVDSTAPAGGTGSQANPFNSWAQWSVQAVGSEILFRGSNNLAAPRQYAGGGILTGKNFILRNWPDEHVQLLDLTRHQAFIFRSWTAGTVEVQGTGSFRFGPSLPQNPQLDSGWTGGALVLEGCQGNAVTPIIFEGGPNKRLIFNSESDRGLQLANFGSTGTKFVSINRVEATDNAAGIYVRSPSGFPEGQTGEGCRITNSILHHNQRMGNGTGSGDVGAQGIGFERSWGTSTYPIFVAFNEMYENHADSTQYGEDGIGFETFNAGWILFYRNIVHNCAGFYETGGDSNGVNSHHIFVIGNLFYGLSNGLSATSASPGILLRDFTDSVFAFNSVDLGPNPTTAYLLELYDDTGTFGGAIDRVRILNNILFQRNARVVYRVQNLPPAGPNFPVINYNIVRRLDASTFIADYNGQSPINRTWAQWQAHGFDLNGKTVDPLWVNRDMRDYALQDASPAVDAGLDFLDTLPASIVALIDTNFNGAAPDMGAFESGEVDPPMANAFDTYTRSAANLGTADIGGAYTSSGTTSTDGDEGKFSVTSNATVRTYLPSATFWTEQDIKIKFKTDKLASGASAIEFYLNGRQLNQDADLYSARVKFNASAQVFLNIVRRLSSAQSVISNSGSDLQISRETHVADTYYWIRLQCTGTSPTTIRAKVWRASTSEPASWDTSTTDSSSALQVAGTTGMRAFCGNTNGTVVYTFDDLMGGAINESHSGSATVTGGGVATYTARKAATRTQALTGGGVATVTAPRKGALRTQTIVGGGVVTYAAARASAAVVGASGGGVATPVGAPGHPGTATATGGGTVVPIGTPVVDPVVLDTFTRTNASSLGSADIGGAYSGVAPVQSTDGDEGVVSVGSNQTIRMYLPAVSVQDIETLIRVKVDKLATTNPIEFYLTIRQLNQDADMYAAVIKFTATQTVLANIVKRVSSVQTALIGTDTNITRETHVADTYFFLRFQVVGTAPASLRMKVWRYGTAEPSNWDLSTTDSTAALQVAGAVGFRMFASNTNGTVVYTIDSLSAAEPDEASGSAVLTGSGAVSFQATKATTAALSVTGGGVATAVRTSARTRAQTLTGGGVVALVQTTNRNAAVTVTGGGSVDPNPIPNINAAVNLTGGGVATTAQTTARAASVACSGGGAIVAAGTAQRFRSQVLTGGGIVIPVPLVDHSTSIGVTGSGAITSSGQGQRSTAQTLSGGGVITLQSILGRQLVATVTGAGAINAVPTSQRMTAIQLTGGAGDVVPNGMVGHMLDVDVTGNGTVLAQVTSERFADISVTGGGGATLVAENLLDVVGVEPKLRINAPRHRPRVRVR